MRLQICKGSIKHYKKHNNIENLLYIISGFLTTGWAIGYFGMNAPAFIHVMLAFAVVALVLRIAIYIEKFIRPAKSAHLPFVNKTYCGWHKIYRNPAIKHH